MNLSFKFVKIYCLTVMQSGVAEDLVTDNTKHLVSITHVSGSYFLGNLKEIIHRNW